MKRKLLAGLATGFFVIGMVFFYSPIAQATIISGNHFTKAGKAVDLQGLEWLSLDMTKGYSRTQIENGYFGLIADGWE